MPSTGSEMVNSTITTPPLNGQFAWACRPQYGETVCGDGVGWWPSAQGWVFALVDGLGHGEEARIAAESALLTVQQQLTQPLTTLFTECDHALFSTRGAALAVGRIQCHGSQCEFEHAAVGNIRTVLWRDGKVRRFGAARGIVGAGFFSLYTEKMGLQRGDWLLFYSDGIAEAAPLTQTLPDRVPDQPLAEQLLAQWADGKDDAALLLYRHE